MPHGAKNAMKTVTAMLFSAFLMCQPKKSKGWTAWKRKTPTIASTRKQSR